MRKKTKGLFIDSSTNPETDLPKFTLRLDDLEKEGEVYRSAYKIYMNSATEWEAAMEICNGDFQAWENLLKLKWFTVGRNKVAPAHIGLDEWRRHKAMKDINDQVHNLKAKAESGDTNAAKAVIQFIEKADKEVKKDSKTEDKKDA